MACVIDIWECHCLSVIDCIGVCLWVCVCVCVYVSVCISVAGFQFVSVCVFLCDCVFVNMSFLSSLRGVFDYVSLFSLCLSVSICMRLPLLGFRSEVFVGYVSHSLIIVLHCVCEWAIMSNFIDL